MKRQIRRSVFESNSSSTHSLCIATGLSESDLHFPEKVTFSFDEFGWEEDTLDTVQEKANYLYTAISHVARSIDLLPLWKERVQFIYDTLKKHSVECTFEGTLKCEPYVFRHSGDLAFCISLDRDGYLDHAEGIHDFLNEVCSDEDKLLSFLFSKKSFVLTGNDNAETDVDINVDYPHEEFYKGN